MTLSIAWPLFFDRTGDIGLRCDMSPSDQWTLAIGEEDGRKLVYRIRLAAPAFASKSLFPRLLVVLWEYEPANEEELPSPEEVERMTALENLLRPAIEEANQGFLAVIITGAGLREWQWYVRDPDATLGLVNKTLEAIEPFPLQFSVEEADPEWTVYGQFLNITAAGRGKS